MDEERVLDGRYRLRGLLGVGGMAEVHRAHDEVLGREVAVKVLPRSGDADLASRLEAEFRTLAKLSHPGLVLLHDAGRDGDQPYYVMELVEGESLAERITRGPLPAEQVVALGRGVAEALSAVHEAGVVHRDVKPGNVLVRQDGTVKLTDFGIARLVERAAAEDADDAAPRTQTGMLVGTAPYLAPEQVAGKDVGPAADVYSLGLVLLEALTGERAFPGQGVASAVARLERDPEVPDGTPEPLASELRAMTARRPEDRPAAADVAAVLAGRSGATTRQERTTALPQRDRTAVLPSDRERTRVESGPPRRAAAVGPPSSRGPVPRPRPAAATGGGTSPWQNSSVVLGLLLVIGLVVLLALLASGGLDLSRQPDVPLEQDLQRLEQAVAPR